MGATIHCSRESRSPVLGTLALGLPGWWPDTVSASCHRVLPTCRLCRYNDDPSALEPWLLMRWPRACADSSIKIGRCPVLVQILTPVTDGSLLRTPNFTQRDKTQSACNTTGDKLEASRQTVGMIQTHQMSKTRRTTKIPQSGVHSRHLAHLGNNS